MHTSCMSSRDPALALIAIPRQQEVAEEEMDEDEREARRLNALLDKRLVLAAQAIQEDWGIYGFLLAVQVYMPVCRLPVRIFNR